jgi:hypothetical protein
MSDFIEGVFVLLGLIFGLPFLLLILVMTVVVIFNYPNVIYARYRWKQKLRQQARLISKESILANATPGTLIVDAASFNSGTTHCWWTAENVLELAPMKRLSFEELCEHCKPEDLPVDPYSEWCYEQYLHEEQGRALLVATGRARREAQQLLQQRPDLKIVCTSSGLARFAKEMQEATAAREAKQKLGEAGT